MTNLTLSNLSREQILRKYKPKLDKILSSLYLKIFSFVILLQFVVISLFQSRLSIRNNNLNGLSDNCQGYQLTFGLNYMSRYVFENYLFVAYQLFLMYLGLNAIFNHLVLQICIYSLMNFGGYVYIIVQMLEIKVPVDFARRLCPDLTIESKMLKIDLPQFIMYTFFATLTGYLSFKMYLQFGINYYFQKKVGHDESLTLLLKRQVVLKLLLKNSAFFSTVYFIFFIYYLLSFLVWENYILAFAVLIFLLISVLAIKLIRIAFFSMYYETEREMSYFLSLWIFVLIGNVGLCAEGVSYMYQGWYFLFLYNFVYFSVSVTSYLLAWQVKKDFGKGLKEAIEKNKMEHVQLSRP